MNKTVLLTGATGNLGRAVMEHLQPRGYHIYAATRTEGHPAASASCTPHLVDLTNEDSAAAFVRHGLDVFGQLPAAVLTVGGFAMAPLEQTSSADIRKMIDMNFMTAWHVIRPLFSAMKKEGHGRIVLIGARPGLEPAGGTAMYAYTLAKSMLFTLAELLNADGRGADIVTSVVIPGVIDTPANRRAMPDADFSTWVTPRALAEVAGFALTRRELKAPVFKVYGDL